MGIQHCDIALVGGGLVGATLALILNQALPQASIIVVEAQPLQGDKPLQQPSFDGRSSALAPTTVSTLQQLGLWQALMPYATAINSIHVSDAGHWGLSTFTQQDNHGQPLGFVVENAGLGQVLSQALLAHRGIQVLAPATVKRLEANAEGYCLHLEDGSIQASLTLVADGAESPLRQQLGFAVQDKPYHQQALVANVRFSHPHGGRAFERFTAQGPMALLPLGRSPKGTTAALVWTFPTHTIDAAMAQSDAAFLSQLQQQFGYRLGRFCQVGSRKAYPLSLRLATETYRPGVLLFGNAAHYLHPVAGQGFNLSLRDALRLAQVLQQAQAQGKALGGVAVLAAYQQAQQPDQSRTSGLSDAFINSFGRSSAPWPFMRGLGMLLLEYQPQLRARFIEQLSGKALPKAHYDFKPLAESTYVS